MAEPTQPTALPVQQPSQPSQPEFKLWNAPVQSTSASASADLPEEYFQPTAAEITSAYAAQTRAREALSNGPLKTQAIREREERARISKWPNVCWFPDRA